MTTREAMMCILAAMAYFSAATVARAEPPDFERDVAPVLVNHCLECHQPNKPSGDLNLSTLTGLMAGGSQGAAVAPGKPAQSLALERITSGEMPPPDDKHSKPLSATQVDVMRNWIAAGAPWPKDRELGLHEKAVDLTEARKFWSFQPIRRPAVPATVSDRIANPIDAFVAKALAEKGLAMAPRASSHALHRRMSLDVRGYPPSLEEQDEFDRDPPESRHDRLVDRLLSDPAYGERWARHWLDLVRYADSNGYERDGPKPSVWKYRDYVIDAFNRDLPYDRFVVEQLAGDELDDATAETVIATGYHALGTWQDEVDPLEAPQYRADELDDMIRTTSQTFLGLTLGCARCHQHKFDPLTMVDYYSLSAILAPLKRPNMGRTDRDLPLGTRAEIDAETRRNDQIAALDRRIAEIEKSKASDAAKQVASLREEQQRLRQQTPDLPRAYFCFEDTPQPEKSHLLLFGRASNRGPVMQPRVPDVLASTQPVFPPPAERSTRRRLTFARWLTDPENPLTARVMVNRVWQHHFGTGLVATSSDFGRMGARPSHPELLDWLAHWFIQDANWSLKKLHRLILTSETYRQSTADSETAAAVDPENALLWRFPYRRLDVEAIRDSMLAVAGNVNRRMYGPAVMLSIPAEVIEAHTDKQAAWQPAGEPDIFRRTVYAYVKRTLLVPMLESLDFCDTTQSTERRAITSVAPQSLTLFNGEFANRQARLFAARLERECSADRAERIERAFRLALCRPPTAGELSTMQQFLAREFEHLRRESPAVVPEEIEHKATGLLCRVLLNLNEFVYPD